MFGLTPRVFPAKPDFAIGEIVILPGTDAECITAAAIDSDEPSLLALFSVERYEDIWQVVWKGERLESGTYRYEVPLYVEFEQSDGTRGNWKGSFSVFARGEHFDKPTIKYIDGLASKVGTSEYVTIHGHGFNDDMDVFIVRPDGDTVKVPDTNLLRKYGEPDGYDTISFVFGDPFVLKDSDCSEVCGVYGLVLGYGDADAYTAIAGSGDMETLWDSNIALIRYRYDLASKTAMEKTPAGAVVTVDPSCFYSTELSLVNDDYSSSAKGAQEGVTGSLGKSVYFRIPEGADCSKMGYYRVRMKHSGLVPKKNGEYVLDGIALREGDLVWLDAQHDGGDGLWIVRAGDWEGLKSFLDSRSGNAPENDNPCWDAGQEPLPVDGNVIADLGARIVDSVTVVCDGDVPMFSRYGDESIPTLHGTGRICGHDVKPGNTVLLTNQSTPGTNGIWEVTCGDWVQRTDDVPPHSGNTISGDDFLIMQNDIDFCTCEHSGKSIFHIWYYYLNGSCYLAKATRTVKISCARRGSLFPTNRVDVTDYRIIAGADKELVNNVHRTAGDPVKDTCTEEIDRFDVTHGVNVSERDYNCLPGAVPAPTGVPMCDCDRIYTFDVPSEFSSRDRNGFSIVFWQRDEDDGKWHLFAYVGSGRYDTGMDYLVYHLCTEGIAHEADVDENSEVILDDGVTRTRDAWFVQHGGHLATGFGLFDDTWNFKVTSMRPVVGADGMPITGRDGNPVLDEVVEYTHELTAKTLYSYWSIGCTTTACAVRVYDENSVLRKTCDDMHDPEMEGPVMSQVTIAPNTWGFRFYDEAIGKQRLCSIWNSVVG